MTTTTQNPLSALPGSITARQAAQRTQAQGTPMAPPNGSNGVSPNMQGTGNGTSPNMAGHGNGVSSNMIPGRAA